METWNDLDSEKRKDILFRFLRAENNEATISTMINNAKLMDTMRTSYLKVLDRALVDEFILSDVDAEKNKKMPRYYAHSDKVNANLKAIMLMLTHCFPFIRKSKNVIEL